MLISFSVKRNLSQLHKKLTFSIIDEILHWSSLKILIKRKYWNFIKSVESAHVNSLQNRGHFKFLGIIWNLKNWKIMRIYCCYFIEWKKEFIFLWSQFYQKWEKWKNTDATLIQIFRDTNKWYKLKIWTLSVWKFNCHMQ